MADLITQLEQVTPDWLTLVLARQGLDTGISVTRIDFEPRLPGYSQILPLDVSYSQPVNFPSRFILKLSAEERRDQREVEFYKAVTGISGLPVIRSYHSAYDEETGRFHILMEDLRETHGSHPPSVLPPTIANAERIVDALAQFQAFWWDSAQFGSLIGELPTETSIDQSVNAAVARLSSFSDFLGDRLSDRKRQILESASHALLRLKRERLLPQRNLTLLHGDLHAGNFLYPRNPKQDAIRLIDWKSWSIDPGASDMANLMSVYWTQERRQQLQDYLLRRYHQRLLEHGIVGYTWENCWYDYRLAVIDNVFFPIWQWSVGIPDVIWWHNFERLMQAYDDLGCAELL